MKQPQSQRPQKYEIFALRVGSRPKRTTSMKGIISQHLKATAIFKAKIRQELAPLEALPLNCPYKTVRFGLREQHETNGLPHTRTRHYWCSRSDVGIAIGIPNAKTRASADNQLCFAAVSPRWIATEPRNKYTPKRIDDE